jgi:hypothetical protein
MENSSGLCKLRQFLEDLGFAHGDNITEQSLQSNNPNPAKTTTATIKGSEGLIYFGRASGFEPPTGSGIARCIT